MERFITVGWRKTVPPTQLVRAAPSAWRWLKLPDLSPFSREELRKKGYIPLPEDQPLLAGCIAGQMGRLYQIEQSDGTVQIWGHKHDVAWAEANPVALGVVPPALLFQLLSGSAGTINLDSRRPPPGVGQKAFIADGERWQLVECSISSEVETLYQALDQYTRSIWGDPGSEPQSSLLWICRMPGGYELHRQVWQEAKFAQRSSSWWRGFLPSPKDEEQFRWDGWLSRLEGAQRAVHAAPSVSDQTWEELRQQMQSLAAAYYRAGRPSLRLIPPAVEASQRLLLASPVITSKKADPLIAIPNDPISRSLFTALRDPTCFQVDEELAIVRCNISTSEPHRQGVLSISLPATASGLGDHLAATWLAILSLLLPKLQRDETNLTAPIALSSKILLEQLQLTMTKGAYTPDQYRRLLQEAELMSRIQVQITWTKPQSARREQVPSPLIFLTLSEDISGRRDITTIALGSWVLGVADFLKDHCLIPATILKLPRFQQRLGLELALAFASAPKGGIDITLGTLLVRAGIALDTHTPQNTIHAVMQALSKLAEQKIIDDSPYPSLVEGSREVYFFRWLGSSTADIRAQQEVVEHHLVRKWWEHLLNQRVHFNPPRVASDSVPFVRGKSEASFP